MKIFERYFIDDKIIYKEIKNFYYKLINDEKVCDKIFEEFGLNLRIFYIINGYILVKVKEGEFFVKVNGKFLIIDGGFLRVY